MPSTVTRPPAIAIVGSVDRARAKDLGIREPDAAIRAAELLGRELATQGLSIVVYSSDLQFVEGAVVRGYVASGAAKPASIEVRRPHDGDDAEFPELAERPELFDVRPDSSGDWEVSFYRSLLASAGVVLVGGGRSTHVAGVVALTLRIPVLALACFGGHAEKAWAALERARNDASEEEIATMAQRPWRDELTGPLVASLVGQYQRRAAREAARRSVAAGDARRTRVSLLVGLALLAGAIACIVVGFSVDPGSTASLAIIVGAPALAAAAGAIVRHVSDDGHEWVKTTVLGTMVGAVAALLFIAPQLLTSPDVLKSEDAARLLFFVVPVGFVAGLTYDDVYRKLRRQDVTKVDAFQ